MNCELELTEFRRSQMANPLGACRVEARRVEDRRLEARCIKAIITAA